MKIRQYNTNQTYDEYIRCLEIEHDLTTTGCGSFSTVFLHPTDDNVVVKVFDTAEDGGYIKWLKFALDNQDNPFVPKILFAGKYNYTHSLGEGKYKSSYYVVFIEKLTHINGDEFATIALNFLKVPKEIVKKTDSIYTQHNAICSELRNYPLKYAKHRNKQVAEIFSFLAKHEEGIDLHDENIMYRGTQLVFTDPLAI